MFWWIFLILVFVKACVEEPILGVALLVTVPLAIWAAFKLEGMPEEGSVYDDSFEKFVPMPYDAPYDDSFEQLVEMPHEKLVPMPADCSYDDNFEKP